MSEQNDRAASDEINPRLPQSFQILAAWAKERGLIAKPEQGADKK